MHVFACLYEHACVSIVCDGGDTYSVFGFVSDELRCLNVGALQPL